MQETVLVSASKGKNGLRVQKEKNTIAAAGIVLISSFKMARQYIMLFTIIKSNCLTPPYVVAKVLLIFEHGERAHINCI